jgi:transcription elongation factor GreA
MRLPILDKLEKQLMDSKKELDVDIPKALKIATAMGDLSENAEYKSAKERQMFLESRISQLQKRIGDITSIDVERIPKDRSGLGSTLLLKHVDSGEEREYFLVFPEEVDPDTGKLSMASPVGRTLAGKMEGDEVEVPVEGERQSFEVIQLKTIHQENG